MTDQYLTWLATRRVAPNTLKAYRTQLATYEAWLGRAGLDAADVTYRDAEAFSLSPTVHGKPPAASTANVRLAAVKGYHDWLTEHDAGRPVRLARAPKAPKRNPKPVPDEAWLAVWNSKLDLHDRVLLGLGYYCGLRRSEIVALAPTAVDVEQGQLVVIGKGDKERAVDFDAAIRILEYEVPHLTVHADLWLSLLRHVTLDRRSLQAHHLWWDTVGTPEQAADRLRWHMRRILQGAGLPPDTFTIHQLRHSAATNLLRAGLEPAEIQDFMGHDSYNTSRRYLNTAGTLRRALRKRERECHVNL